MGDKPSESDTELLAASECWNLLREVSVGRLAVWVKDGPDIFPINYTVDHGTVVFRTGQGTKLEAALSDLPVAVEADGVNPESGVAWSVVVRGRAERLVTTEDLVGSFSLPLFPWEAGKKDTLVRVVPDTVSGRRFTVATPITWWNPI